MHLGFTLRQRIRDWRTSLTFIGVIGIAIIVAGAWFAVARPLLTGALPFSHPERLAAIETVKQSGERSGMSWMDLEDLRGGSVEFIAGFLPRTWGLQTENHGHIEVVLSQQITPEFFKTLGIDIDAAANGDEARVWFSHSAWQEYLRGEPHPTGQTVWLNAVPYRVAGVLPGSFDFPHQGESPDIYIPLNRAVYWKWRGGGGLGVITLLKPDVTMAQFRSELAVRAAVLAAQFPSTDRDLRFATSDLNSFLLGDRLLLLRWLMIGVFLLLLTAMANGGGIWLSQWLRQQRRIAIQLSLGASMRRVFLEQTMQVLALAIVASAVGLSGASLVLAALRASTLFGPELARFELWQRASLNPADAILLTLITLVASLLSAWLPLLAVRGNVSGPLHAGYTARARSSRRLRLMLATAQLTITGTLAYAGIMISRNVDHILGTTRGFRVEQILSCGIGISEAKYDTDEKMIAFHQRALEELRRVPGVIGAAGGLSLPVSNSRTRFLVDNDVLARERQPMSSIGFASPELLPMLGIPLLRGRLLSASDRWATPRVALVNQAFADRYLAADPLSHSLRISFYNGFAAQPYQRFQIVGVIGNTLNRDLATVTEPEIVIGTNQMAFEGFRYFLRSSLPAASLAQSVQQAIWRVGPEVQRVKLTPLVDRIEKSLVSRRLLDWLLNLFGSIAALVVIFGLAAALTATFLEMTRDLAIRSALGAPRLALAFESVRWAMFAVLTGELLIAPISVALGRIIVLDRAPAGWDAVSWLAASVLLLLVGIGTALTPARKAASVNPATTLRCE